MKDILLKLYLIKNDTLRCMEPMLRLREDFGLEEEYERS